MSRNLDRFLNPPTDDDSAIGIYLQWRESLPNPFWTDFCTALDTVDATRLRLALDRWSSVSGRTGPFIMLNDTPANRSRSMFKLAGMVAFARALVVDRAGDRQEYYVRLGEAAKAFASGMGVVAAPPLGVELDVIEVWNPTVGEQLRALREQQDPSPPVANHAIDMPVLLQSHKGGQLGFLHVARFSRKGRGKVLVPDIGRLGFLDFDDAFRDSIETAWSLAKQEFDTGDRIRWWLTVPLHSEIHGDSAGAAFAVALYCAARRLRFQPAGLSGSIRDDGTIGPVGGHLEKAVVLQPAGLTRFLVSHEDSRAAELLTLYFPGIDIRRVTHVKDALAMLGGVYEAVIAYLSRSIRTWATDPWWDDSEPDRVSGPHFETPLIRRLGETRSTAWNSSYGISGAEPRRIAILGGTGTGKSTLLRHEAWRTARDQLAELERGKITLDSILLPVVLSARDAAEDAARPMLETIVEHIQRTMPDVAGIDSFVQGRIEDRRFALFLERWHEVQDVALNGFLLRLTDARIPRLLVTSRHAGAAGLERIVGGNSRELVAWDDDRIERFLTVRGASDATRIALRGAGDDPSAYHGLLQNPLMLSIVCRTPPPQLRRGRLRRAELWRVCLVGLLGVGPIARGGMAREMTDTELVALGERIDDFAAITWELSSADPTRTTFGVEDIHRAIRECGRAEVVFDELTREHGLLIRADHASRRYRFLHSSLADFLLAWSLKERTDFQSAVAARLYDPRWANVLSLVPGVLAGLADDEVESSAKANDYIRAMLTEATNDALLRPLLLAGRAATECPDNALRAVVAATLVETYLSNVCPIPRDRLADAIAELGATAAERLADAVRERPELRIDPWAMLARRDPSEGWTASEVRGCINLPLLFHRMRSDGKRAAARLVADADSRLAAFALSLIESTGATPAVRRRAVQLLSAAEPVEVRREAAQFLASFPASGSVEMLLDACLGEDDALARRCTAALAEAVRLYPDERNAISATRPDSARYLDAATAAFTSQTFETRTADMLARLRKTPAAALGDLVPELADVPSAFLDDVAQALGDRLRAANEQERLDVEDAIHMLLRTSLRFAFVRVFLANDDPDDGAAMSESLGPDSLTPPLDDSLEILLDAWRRCGGARPDVVAALWKSIDSASLDRTQAPVELHPLLDSLMRFRAI